MERDYMTFEQASAFLNTPRSTLYRWLREGRVPGHKLGRQWRFLREELESFRAAGPASPAAFDALDDALGARGAAPAPPASRLLWDAFDARVSCVHLQPNARGDFDILYRTHEGLESLCSIDSATFDALETAWRELGAPIASDDDRLALTLTRDPDDLLQVRVQHLATSAGPRLTLRLLRASQVRGLDEIAQGEDVNTLRRFAVAPHGLVLIAGPSGSGKTTTAYACLGELAALGDRVLFSLEPSTEHLLPGVNQVEVDLDSERAYRAAFGAVFDSDPDVLFLATGFAPRHRSLIFQTALNAAESGHLVFVQLEADGPEDALERFQSHVERPVDDHVVGVSWQEMVVGEQGERAVRYALLPGPLDA